jgi:hypothetical protein
MRHWGWLSVGAFALAALLPGAWAVAQGAAGAGGAAAAVPAYRPFIDPLPAWAMEHWYIWLTLLSLLVSLTYKAVRVRSLRELPYQTLLMTAQTVLGMIGLAAASYLLVEVYVTWLRGG